MALTPGIYFILQQAPLASVPFVAYYVIERLQTPLPRPVLIAISTIVLPAWFCLSAIFNQWNNRRLAARLGARTVPKTKGKKLGNVDIFRSLIKSAHEGYVGDVLGDICAANGHTADFWVFWESNIITTEPAHIKQILSTEFNNFEKGGPFRSAMSSVLGTGVFNSDGDMWKFHRTMTRPFFTKDRISHFELFDRHASEIITKMKARLQEGYSVNFQDAMFRFTLDSATEYLFGSSVHSTSSTWPYPQNASIPFHSPASTTISPADAFAEAFKNAQVIAADRARAGWIWPLFEITKSHSDPHMEIVNSYVQPIIEEALKQRSQKKAAKEKDDETLLEHLINETEDPVVLRDEIINIMIAGRDTTAVTLTFIFYFLSIYPHVLERLRDEILTRVGPNAMPTYDDVREMKYLRAVINETLRLYPVVPFNIRHSINATTFPSSDPTQPPLFIPANTKVSYSVFLMHRRTDLWGPDAEVFDPDRFLSTDPRMKKYLLANSFIFLPFNAGPRICLGQQFAYNEMSFMIVRLLQNFSQISLDMSSHPPDKLPPQEWATDQANIGKRKGIDKVFPKCHLTMYNFGGLWLNMSETKKEAAAQA